MPAASAPPEPLTPPGARRPPRLLRDQGIFPTSLEAAGAVRSRDFRALFRRGQTVAVAELAAATRQLATLINAGLALDDALATVAEQAEIPLLHQTLTSLREAVRQGESLHAALANYPRLFPADLCQHRPCRRGQRDA